MYIHRGMFALFLPEVQTCLTNSQNRILRISIGQIVAASIIEANNTDSIFLVEIEVIRLI
jgi:hypothetical protein